MKKHRVKEKPGRARPERDQGDSDKPAWAMGLAEADGGPDPIALATGQDLNRRRSRRSPSSTEEVTLAERLAPEVRDRLLQWKQQEAGPGAQERAAAGSPPAGRARSATAGAAAGASASSGRSGTAKQAGGEPNAGTEPEAGLSFAELFDPQDEEDTSFAELLESSRLDWRRFKSD